MTNEITPLDLDFGVIVFPYEHNTFNVTIHNLVKGLKIIGV